jgi:ATP-binding cassette, subfamily C, bacterial
MTPIRALFRLLSEAPLGKTLTLLFLMALVSLTEGIGIVMLVPLLAAMGGGGAPSKLSSQVSILLESIGFGTSLGALLVVFLLLVLARSILLYVQRVQTAAFQYRLIDGLRLRCFRALLSAEWRWLSTKRASDQANTLQNGISLIAAGLQQALALIVTLFTVAAYTLAALFLSWQVALAAFGCGLLILFAFSGHRARATALGQDIIAANQSMQASVQEGLAGIRITKILQNEKRHVTAFGDVLGRLRAQQIRFVAATNEAQILVQCVGATLVAGLVYVGVSWWDVPVGGLLTITVVLARLVPMLGAAQQQAHHWLYAVPALAELDELLAECATAAEPSETDPTSSRLLSRSIVLKNVSLTYPSRDVPALEGVSFTIPARTTTAIIGASGAGKSSLADILTGLIEPDSGALLVDGVRINGSARRSWQRSVAYVQQDAFLFHDTIRNNLNWSFQDASEADLIASLRLASAEFVFDLPQGLDSVVGDGGVRLSGGERQRLALARALLAKPALLILDEATSALDLANELAVRNAISELRGDLTIVVIGHRLAMVDDADQVIRLEQGRIKPFDVAA